MSLIVTYLCISRAGHNVWRLPLLRDNQYTKRNGLKIKTKNVKICEWAKGETTWEADKHVSAYITLNLLILLNLCLYGTIDRGGQFVNYYTPLYLNMCHIISSYPVIALHQVFSIVISHIINSLTSTQPYCLFRAVRITHPESPLWVHV